MIVQDKTYICTVRELAETIARRILKDKPGETDFSPVCFSVLSEGYDGKTEPEVIASGAEGWYGIRRVDTGFDDDELTLCANYDGGGSPHFGYLYEGCSEKEIESTIFLIIQGTLRAESPNINGQTMLVAETHYEATPTIAIVMENGAVGTVYCTSRNEKFNVMVVDDNCADDYEQKCYEARQRELDRMLTEKQIFPIG